MPAKPLGPSSRDSSTEIVIHDLTHDGRGVGRSDGKACFVQGALPGEVVSWRKTKNHRQYDEGVLEELLQASPDRIDPSCPLFGTCGGCQIQHLNYAAQISAKELRLKNALAHKKLEPTKWLSPIQSQPFSYRRRARLSVSRNSSANLSKCDIGFKHRASAQVVNVESCLVLVDPLNKLLPHIPELLSLLSNQQRSGVSEIELNLDSGLLSILFISDQKGPDTALDHIPSSMNLEAQDCDIWFRAKHSAASLIYSQRPNMLDETSLVERGQLPSSPPGFMQANEEINRAITKQIGTLLDLKSTDHLLDLFCGSGNFSLAYAQKVSEITGLEGQVSAVEEANKKAEGMTQFNYRVADLFDEKALAANRSAFRRADAVILDPPRAGAEALVKELCKSKPPRILYISCHPATFVRDAEILQSKGYRFDSAGLVDMFPQTMHSEVVGLFRLS